MKTYQCLYYDVHELMSRGGRNKIIEIINYENQHFTIIRYRSVTTYGVIYNMKLKFVDKTYGSIKP